MLGIEIRARQQMPKAMIAFIIVWNVVIVTVLLVSIVQQRAWAFLPVLLPALSPIGAQGAWRRRGVNGARQNIP